MTEMNSLIILLRQIVKSECLDSPWSLFLFGSSCDGLREGSDVDLLLVYKSGDEEAARKFRVSACRRAWGISKLQLDITLLSKEEEKSVDFVSRERATRILCSSE